MKNFEVISLHESLLALDGINRGKPDFKPYNFSPKAIFIIAKNIQVVEPTRIALEKKQLEIQKGGSESQSLFQELMSAEAEPLVFIPMPSDWLNLKSKDNPDGNVMPPSLIRGIMPILTLE